MQKTIYDTAVIGAGASGLMAAITASRLGASVLLLEHMEQAAKKILVTGNGKCNYTNADQSLQNYYCAQKDFIRTVLAQFSYEDTIHFFEQLGIRPIQKNGSCIYPESEQASSVRSVLLAEIQRLHISLLVSVGIRSIHKLHGKNMKGISNLNNHQELFEIQTKDGTFYSRACILASGGKAAKKTGSDGSGYIYAKQLGHTISKPLPALAALLTDHNDRKLPAGVRIGCTAALYVEGEQKALECGELQITDYGISGIVIFQFSSIASKALEEKQKVSVYLDFKPDMQAAELFKYLTKRFSGVYHRQQKVLDGMIGFLPDKLIPVLLKQSGIRTEEVCSQLNRKQIGQLTKQLKQYEVIITGIKGFDFAQVTAGGIPVQEIYAQRMESKKVPGLYFAGEIVDIDGKCGGYNLQWAWSSGYTAGKSCVSK